MIFFENMIILYHISILVYNNTFKYAEN